MGLLTGLKGYSVAVTGGLLLAAGCVAAAVPSLPPFAVPDSATSLVVDLVGAGAVIGNEMDKKDGRH